MFYSQKPSFDAEQKNVKRFLKAVTYTDDRPRGMAKNTILEFQAYCTEFFVTLMKIQIQTKFMEVTRCANLISPAGTGVFSYIL